MNIFEQRKWSILAALVVLFLAASVAHAAIPGQQDLSAAPTFNLTASAGYASMPDGASIYSWGYGAGSMQLPGPTLIVAQGATVTVNLSNQLPAAAGNTSIVFPGLTSTATGGVAGVLTHEAQPGGTVQYSFTASRPGTFLYHSGTRTDLQVEMGLYGAIVVVPDPTLVPTGCTALGTARPNPEDADYRLSPSAYGVPGTCYDREYLFVLSEIQIEIHQAVEAQASGPGPIEVAMEPYQPEYWMINGRGAPSTMEGPNLGVMPHQPYNSFPRMHPGEKLLLRVVGAGRQMHSFHTHGNHVRVFARDGNLLLTPGGALESKLEFSIPSLPGQTVDGVFEWTGKDLGWDVYGHPASDTTHCSSPVNGYDPFTHEYCADHGKPIPVRLPNPNVLENGAFYSGSPFLSDLVQLPPGQGGMNVNAGMVYMWHSHVERELTNGNVFPGGLMTMLIVDPPGAPINELQ
jgi:FtsP/CotA-like multicopper oxidase with cupredoxin domain